MRLREIEKQELKKRINILINELVKTTRDKNISDEELKYIANKTFEFFENSNDFESALTLIYEEIAVNYRRYIPFCYASIRTAYRVIIEKSNV